MGDRCTRLDRSVCRQDRCRPIAPYRTFARRLVRRALAPWLAAAGVATFADRFALIRGRRRRYRVVPRPGGASRTATERLRHAAPRHARAPVAARRHAAPGFGRQPPVLQADIWRARRRRGARGAAAYPAALDGSAGLNRAPAPSCHAERATNLQGVHPWIAICGARSEAPLARAGAQSDGCCRGRSPLMARRCRRCTRGTNSCAANKL